ncbi:MAG: hypothetical protein A3G24_13555 [Betaproteobacteria bacterium RIFCSPLOWO2_12_FULL_62_13]|nr:MAG: hypothetical protein A3G24_13555 [Betaproteobacteria bacterium RIFCSPLOWO2_12_FULL_62_13]
MLKWDSRSPIKTLEDRLLGNDTGLTLEDRLLGNDKRTILGNDSRGRFVADFEPTAFKPPPAYGRGLFGVRNCPVHMAALFNLNAHPTDVAC